uniref:Uncharacterized protein n=1 Tax=Myoviridae sp. ctdNl2 TaxID=2825140 RepID=A0A8S5QI36_9CAUD|nr:MAG TPA: hypothetical protein [Myoviridae sp. ctdNl2]
MCCILIHILSTHMKLYNYMTYTVLIYDYTLPILYIIT